MLREVKALLSPSHSTRQRARSEDWCRGLCLERNAILQQITNQTSYTSIHVLHREELETAQTTVNSIPIRMGGPGDIELLYQIAVYLKAAHVIETGLAYGWSSLAILLAIQHRQQAHLISVDMPYPALGNERHVGSAVLESLHPYCTLIRRADRTGLPMAIAQLRTIDMCHYDSDKSYEGRMWAYPRLWEALRDGGVFISDDVNDNQAFRDFCESLGGAALHNDESEFQPIRGDYYQAR
jgi:predicted O-methyltransferase YrrM